MMHGGGYTEQLLYLIVYSVSIISAAAVFAFRKRLDTDSDRILRRIILCIAACTTLMSVQVFLNAVGILEKIDEANSSRVIIIMNILIIAVFAVLTYSIVSMSLTLRPAIFGRYLRQALLILTAALLLNAAILQILSLFNHSPEASTLLGILMICGTALFEAGTVFSAIRLLIPLSATHDAPILRPLRIFLFALIVFPTVFFISGSLFGTLLAPVGFICLNILALRILYIRLNTAPQPAVPPQETVPDPASSCRELGLSKRETEVALLLSEGRSYKEIAAELFISVSTTQTHVGRIYSKLDANSKTELTGLLYYKKNSLYDKK